MSTPPQLVPIPRDPEAAKKLAGAALAESLAELPNKIKQGFEKPEERQ